MLLEPKSTSEGNKQTSLWSHIYEITDTSQISFVKTGLTEVIHLFLLLIGNTQDRKFKAPSPDESSEMFLSQSFLVHLKDIDPSAILTLDDEQQRESNLCPAGYIMVRLSGPQ